ncbi:hypothetical protein CDAR_365541 [Caerostris darwini]|uniref:Uncharacterized protein n=1 Tax=Caerostris darwini TaxID=1538125 RepID=A0AAV4RGP3_9ARAC|nr:hypothetical protein CDAR_365541 [Caerostris darwini]
MPNQIPLSHLHATDQCLSATRIRRFPTCMVSNSTPWSHATAVRGPFPPSGVLSRPYIRSSRIPSCGNPSPVFSAIFPNVALSQHAGSGRKRPILPPTLSLCKDFVNGLQLLFFEVVKFSAGCVCSAANCGIVP